MNILSIKFDFVKYSNFKILAPFQCAVLPFFFLLISSLSFKLSWPWYDPILVIHLYSNVLSLSHWLHRQPAPGLWLAILSFSSVVSKCSKRDIFTWLRFGPEYWEQPLLKWVSRPVLGCTLSRVCMEFMTDFVFDQRWVMEVVDPTYWYVPVWWIHSSR